MITLGRDIGSIGTQNILSPNFAIKFIERRLATLRISRQVGRRPQTATATKTDDTSITAAAVDYRTSDGPNTG